MASPIWKDYFVTFGSNAYYDYEIRLGSASGPAIYAGRAYKRPGAASVVVRINDVCADWLSVNLPSLPPYAGFTSLECAATFAVVDVTGTATTKDTVTFYADWSYDRGFNPATMPLSDPVTGEVDPRQYLLVPVLNASSVNATLTYRDGTTATVSIQVAKSADFNDDFNADFADTETGAGSGCAVVNLGQWTGLASVTIGGRTYKVREDTCTRYALYYVNAYGGWDTLLLDGSCKTSDALTRHTAELEYDNNDESARGLRDYAVEVARLWTLNTGLLTDEQSSRMHHALNTTNAFLCDLLTGELIPVVLTDTDHARKTFKADGRQIAQYTFNAKEAQAQVRR